MTTHKLVRLTRRQVLKLATGVAATSLLAACGAAATPTPAPTAAPKVIEKEVTKVVEKQVTQIVEKQVTQIVEKPVTQVVEKVVTATPPAARKGGTFIVAMNGDIASLDPYETNLTVWNQIRRHIFNPLLTGDNDTLKLAPCLATEWKWENSTTLVMKLRQSVKFHNGEPFTADDVKYTMERVLSGAVDAQYTQRVATINTVQVRGPYEVAFNMKRVDPGILDVFPLYMMMSKSVPVDKIKSTPVGTGAFKYVSWKPIESVTVEANPGYWLPGLPRLDRITFRIMTQEETRLASLITGDVHADGDVALTNIGRLMASKGVTVTVTPPYGANYCLYVNVALPELKDLRVRQALLYAFDRNAFSRVIFAGMMQLCNTPAAPGNPCYNPEVDKLYPFDLAKAKQLLVEAGYPGGKGLPQMEINLREWQKTMAEFLQASLKEIGIDCRIMVRDNAAAANMNNVIKTAHFSFDGYTAGFASGNELYRSAHFMRPDATANPRGFKPGMYPDFDKALAAAEVELDPDKSNELYKVVQLEYAKCLAGGFMLVRGPSCYAARSIVQDVRRFPTPYYEYAWLNQ